MQQFLKEYQTIVKTGEEKIFVNWRVVLDTWNIHGHTWIYENVHIYICKYELKIYIIHYTTFGSSATFLQDMFKQTKE